MPHRIATQLFTFRHQLAEDPQRVLDRVAEIGFTAVEAVYSITGGLTAAEQRRALDARGLTVCAVHAFYDELSGDPDAVFAAARELGAEHVVCAWLDAEERRDAAGYERVARRLGELGERCAEQGLRLAYHHHDFELATLPDGRRGMEVIWDAVDPKLLAAEVDVYWVHEAGLDPIAYLTALGDRVTLLHCKDHAPDDAPPLAEWDEGVAVHNTEIGTGVLDFEAILRAAPGAEWLIAEQDLTVGDPFASAAISLRNLERLARTGAVA